MTEPLKGLQKRLDAIKQQATLLLELQAYQTDPFFVTGQVDPRKKLSDDLQAFDREYNSGREAAHKYDDITLALKVLKNIDDFIKTKGVEVANDLKDFPHVLSKVIGEVEECASKKQSLSQLRYYSAVAMEFLLRLTIGIAPLMTVLGVYTMTCGVAAVIDGKQNNFGLIRGALSFMYNTLAGNYLTTGLEGENKKNIEERAVNKAATAAIGAGKKLGWSSSIEQDSSDNKKHDGRQKASR